MASVTIWLAEALWSVHQHHCLPFPLVLTEPDSRSGCSLKDVCCGGVGAHKAWSSEPTDDGECAKNHRCRWICLQSHGCLLFSHSPSSCCSPSFPGTFCYYLIREDSFSWEAAHRLDHLLFFSVPTEPDPQSGGCLKDPCCGFGGDQQAWSSHPTDDGKCAKDHVCCLMREESFSCEAAHRHAQSSSFLTPQFLWSGWWWRRDVGRCGGAGQFFSPQHKVEDSAGRGAVHRGGFSGPHTAMPLPEVGSFFSQICILWKQDLTLQENQSFH